MGLFLDESYDTPDCDIDALVEMFLIDDISRLNESQRQDFCKPGGIADALYEAKVFKNKKTIVRLSKQSDLERREMMAAMQLAREAKDPLWTKLHLNRIKEKELLNKISAKYGAKAKKSAIIGQKNYVKKMKSVKTVPASFMAAGGAERV